MCNSDRRHFLGMSLVTLGVLGAAGIAGSALAAETPPKKVYVCPPCGCAADEKQFSEPGTCPECGMTLVERKPEATAPPKGGEQGGGLMATQSRAAPRSARAGRSVSRQGGWLS